MHRMRFSKSSGAVILRCQRWLICSSWACHTFQGRTTFLLSITYNFAKYLFQGVKLHCMKCHLHYQLLHTNSYNSTQYCTNCHEVSLTLQAALHWFLQFYLILHQLPCWECMKCHLHYKLLHTDSYNST